MKKLLATLTLLASLSSFADDCSLAKIETAIVQRYNVMTYTENHIQVGDLISNFENVNWSFLSSLEHYLAINNCPQFEGPHRRLKLKNLFRGQIKVDVVDETGFEFKAKRKRTTTEIATAILSN